MDQPNPDMPIEDLNVSEQCRESWIKSGVRTVDEIVEFFKKIEKGTQATGVNPRVLPYLDETLNQLKVQGCWRDNLQV
jgi:hypothetical protein